jgi:short-subunit dehydrogenase
MSKLALVTGASSGIGWAFAQRLAADGYDLVAVGRRLDRLNELAASLTGVQIEPLAADLSTDEGVDMVARVCATQPLTMLVNNAGVAHYMPIADLPADKARELVHVKVVAPTMLIRAAVPGMVARGAGTIVNVAGMIAFSGPAQQAQLPRRAVYAGTLAHLVAMTQVLHEELKPEGLRLQVLCPGVVATEFHVRQGLDLSRSCRSSP